ncbi:MAG: CTP synthetase [Candidatus Wolfebacteria bacterium GW2011_GWA2_42_10]|uniref:CTP synthase n=2 Tax=Candidatus Wolfeibacteriota TaxID=1752735 RepID=A0A0G0XKC5_9BACT|nr:MAG: CTP synthetase [Candidatus Wolfebacteria bacterium GW2011_GWB1_41_12]KKS25354.1 MAG: CTP synthetase [Candidatus Wolfebacteria bacterium GW2011_GWA2_42_10]KKT56793.1 MAG: CTP synthetase [Candidatus Wolfebacteria bacterium GW2011_GWA1_44_24]
MSGVGKGVTTASIGKILQARGFEVTAMKIDPYVNIDAGTMNPTEHGEVFVLDDGMECDQDMGNYERFLDRDLTADNYMTTGSVYLSVINKERNLEYHGSCVEVVPHIPLEVIGKIDKAASKNKAEIVITEIGGTVGEYQNILFLEAIRILKLKKPDDVLLVLVSYLPQQGEGGELKTKPTQYAVRTLNSAGIQPDIIIARAGVRLDKKRKDKIGFNCNVREQDVISAPDVESIYEVPLNFEKDNLSQNILEKLNLKSRGKNLREWQRLAGIIRKAKKPVKIGIVGKYFGAGEFILSDSYISVIEAIKHAACALKVRPIIQWLNAEEFEGAKSASALKKLSDYHGVIIPGGFGSRGIKGKLAVIKYLRSNKIPFLGLCYGMQLAVIEFSRSVAGLKNANTTEIEPNTPHPVIDILPEQKKNLTEKNYGGTMRLGACPAALKKNTIAASAYKNFLISERHRHRYEVNPKYIEKLEKKGLVFSGFSPNRQLMEIIELPKEKHPFFVATQFHPEFKSKPLKPHPLFREFMGAAVKK